MKKYEDGLPEHTLKQIIAEIAEGNIDSLHPVTSEDTAVDDASVYVDKAQITQFLSEKHAATPLSFVAVNAESTEETKIYTIRSGDEKLLKVYLERNKAKNGKVKKGWHEAKTQLIGEDLSVKDLVVQIPSSGKLLIGDYEVPESFITERGGQIKLLENLIANGIVHNQPTVDTYTIRGIFPESEITMVDASGKRTACTKADETYSAGFAADDAFIAEQTERVLSLFEPYAKYFSGDADGDSLRRVMLDNSPADVNARAADVSWVQYHEGTALSEQSVENFKKYSDDCYSCDIKFKQDILLGGESIRTWDTNMTWVFVWDGNYYVADFVTNR